MLTGCTSSNLSAWSRNEGQPWTRDERHWTASRKKRNSVKRNRTGSPSRSESAWMRRAREYHRRCSRESSQKSCLNKSRPGSSRSSVKKNIRRSFCSEIRSTLERLSSESNRHTTTIQVRVTRLQETFISNTWMGAPQMPKSHRNSVHRVIKTFTSSIWAPNPARQLLAPNPSTNQQCLCFHKTGR